MWTWQTLPDLPYSLNRALSLLARLWGERVERGIGVVGVLTPHTATPALGAARLYRTANTSPTTITAIRGGAAGQEITIVLADALTTLEHNPSLRLAGDADRTGEGRTVRLVTLNGNDWLEVPR